MPQFSRLQEEVPPLKFIVIVNSTFIALDGDDSSNPLVATPAAFLYTPLFDSFVCIPLLLNRLSTAALMFSCSLESTFVSS
mmetsp:Transcript_4591/g.8862  ORF Transcript_4591/g.8862 Transcript_4591/m.8862 type:complete len:81 (-) Transcript_4591:1019-1261(-)